MSMDALRARPPSPEAAALRNHRRALLYAFGLLALLVVLLAAVGRHPPAEAPRTAFRPIGTLDGNVTGWMRDIRDTPLTGTFRVLDKIGSGVVTIPLRAVAALFLLFRRRWRAASAFILTWAASEILLTTFKAWFHRGRPMGSLVSVHGYSFPSGHAIAASAIGVALVLAFMGAGPRRRKWEWLAIGFTFAMAFSRVYLHAHWLSDVVAGVLLGFGVAVASAGLVGEVVSLVRPDPLQSATGEPPTGSTAPPAGSRGS